ncbi:MAG TPA: YggS family pyridoxal phosphate-dependent enzyme [Prolixibacteraceae bacterium]|nr:YggS family pyridoxal phosphate-dependent enzyme [Prolixibacteraceae bacterium]
MTIENNLNKIYSTLPDDVKLVAVSKTKSNEEILEAYEVGQRIFGENKVQELVRKWETLPKDIEWHFIGHLQSNKVRSIAPFISMVHSVDSLKILKTINEEAKQAGRVIPCLLQFHIASEESKFGFSVEEAVQLLTDFKLSDFENVTISGVMGMATYTDDEAQIKKEFSILHDIFQKLKAVFFHGNDNFREISMGMSSDYLYAIESGSTMVRIGSTIFGDRYPATTNS